MLDETSNEYLDVFVYLMSRNSQNGSAEGKNLLNRDKLQLIILGVGIFWLLDFVRKSYVSNVAREPFNSTCS